MFFNYFGAILECFAISLMFFQDFHLIWLFTIRLPISFKQIITLDFLAGGLARLLDSFHEMVDSFCVNFTLFCHLQVVNFRIFQSWNLITCSFWCHAGFVSKVGQWKYANDKENMSEIYCTQFHWLDRSNNCLAKRKRMDKLRWLTLYDYRITGP